MIDKSILGAFAVTLTLVSNAPYIYSILKGKTKPHTFTYILWGLMTAIAAAGQYVGGAGAGAWSGILTSFFCFVILGLSFKHGEKSITRSDWISLTLGLLAIPLWYITASPLPAVILATLIDAMAYYPTFRKSYHKPHQEMMFAYVIANIRHLTSILAMTTYSVTTLLFPTALFLMNAGLIVMVVWRRQTLR